MVDSQTVGATWEDPLDPNGIILSFSLSLQLTPGQDYLLPLPPVTNFTLSPDTFERDIAGLHPFARYEFSLRAATSFGGGSVTNGFATTNEAGTGYTCTVDTHENSCWSIGGKVTPLKCEPPSMKQLDPIMLSEV